MKNITLLACVFSLIIVASPSHAMLKKTAIAFTSAQPIGEATKQKNSAKINVKSQQHKNMPEPKMKFNQSKVSR